MAFLIRKRRDGATSLFGMKTVVRLSVIELINVDKHTETQACEYLLRLGEIF
jgi:hypothetical protein